MKNVIHIYGASGSGTTTLGKRIESELGFKLLDTDDYYWMPTNPPFTEKRIPSERVKRMKREIESVDNTVISGSLVDWGDELIPYFTLAIRIVADTELRIERLKIREREEFGNRIDIGGDMYEDHMAFLEYARAYDSGDLSMRSKAKHDEWQKLLQCEILTVDGSNTFGFDMDVIKKKMNDN